MSSSEDNCAQNCCNDCATSFCQSCGESCSENCETSCENSCNQACQNSCSNATCSCGSGETIGIITLISSLIMPLIGAITLGVFQAFDSEGPILLTLLGSCILAVNLTGIQIGKKYSATPCKQEEDQEINRYTTRFGKLLFKHSHHSQTLILRGHEFKLKGKYFCTGCYGILLGTLCSIFIAFLYLVYGLDITLAKWILLIAPFCFVPIIFRYYSNYNFPTSLRLIFNSLLPIGGCLLLIGFDAIFGNWSLNVLIATFIVLSAYLRSIIVQKDKD